MGGLYSSFSNFANAHGEPKYLVILQNVTSRKFRSVQIDLDDLFNNQSQEEAMDETNRIATKIAVEHIDSKDRIHGGKGAETDIIALKNYMNAQYIGEILVGSPPSKNYMNAQYIGEIFVGSPP